MLILPPQQSHFVFAAGLRNVQIGQAFSGSASSQGLSLAMLRAQFKSLSRALNHLNDRSFPRGAAQNLLSGICVSSFEILFSLRLSGSYTGQGSSAILSRTKWQRRPYSTPTGAFLAWRRRHGISTNCASSAAANACISLIFSA